MKFKSLTKPDKRNKMVSKKFDDGLMSVNYEVIF